MVRSGSWRYLPALLAVAVLASACSGSNEPSAGPASQSVGGSSEGLPDALGSAGFEVVDEPGAPGSGEGLELWSFQVENLVREVDEGGGYLGVQLDELVGSPGGLPFSYLLAGWLSSEPTPAAKAASESMGDQPWEQAPSLVYPTAVLVLFVGDAVEAGGGAAGAESGVGRLMSLAQEGVCSSLANWVSQALDFIFESLKVNADTDSFLGWLGTIWNAAVDLARWAVEGLIELLTAPVVAAITDALVIVGTLSMIGSFLKPWNVDVTPSNLLTRFAVGGEGDIAETFEAEVDTGIEVEWPASIVDCADVAGLDLPDPSSAENSKASWTTAGLPGLGDVTRNQNVIDSENMARLDWVTGREESDSGEDLSGLVSATVSVVSKQIEELKSLITGLVSGQVGSTVGGVISLLTDPIIDMLAELIQPSGSASVTVVYHDHEDDDTSASPPMGWAWQAQVRASLGFRDRYRIDGYAIISFDFAEGQAIDEQKPKYVAQYARVYFPAVDQPGICPDCTVTASAAEGTLLPESFLMTDQAGFLQFDLTEDPVTYHAQIFTLGGLTHPVTHAVPPHTNVRDFAESIKWVQTHHVDAVLKGDFRTDYIQFADSYQEGTGEAGFTSGFWEFTSCDQTDCTIDTDNDVFEPMITAAEASWVDTDS